METKVLRLEGAPGKLESLYLMSVPVPGRLDLLNVLDKPPYHICSKDDTTYTTGVLAHVPHSLKLRISRDYQEPFVGLFIKINPKPDDLIDIAEVKGTFVVPNSNKNKSSQNGLLANCAAKGNRTPPSHNAPTPSPSSPGPEASSVQVPFSLFKSSSASKLPDLDGYTYFESSRCPWPDLSCLMELSIKIVKTTYSFFVDDDNDSSRFRESHNAKNIVSSEPYFLSDLYSDIRIQVGKEVFPAHKIILSERSHYFSRMFASSMRESTEGLVKIPEEDEPHFFELLRFIYHGSVENLEENAEDLYILADKYDMPQLTSVCEEYLLGKLNVENAMELYDLSQSVGPTKSLLARRAKELIMWNRDKFVRDLESFKEFAGRYPEVVFELLRIN